MNNELLLFGKHFNGWNIFFAGKFSYIVVNKGVDEKVVEMSNKRKQFRNSPYVFCYICSEYIMSVCIVSLDGWLP